MLPSNQISQFFGLQFLMKETINILDFFHIDSYQGKIASKTTVVGWMGPSMLNQAKCT